MYLYKLICISIIKFSPQNDTREHLRPLKNTLLQMGWHLFFLITINRCDGNIWHELLSNLKQTNRS